MSTPPPLLRDARPLGFMLSAWIYTRSIVADVGHRVLVNRKRDRARVNADYEQGGWSRELAARAWEKSDNLQDYVERQWLERRLKAQIGGRLWSVPAPAYYRFRRARLVEIMRRFAGSTDVLIELGSGTGSIVFELAAERQRQCLLGLELSPTGRKVGSAVADYFGLENVEFGPIDLLDPASEGYARLAGRTVFTHYCLEQLPNHTEAIFRNLVAAGIKRAILIEPTFELLRWYSLRDLASMTYVLRQDYQRKILRSARKLEAEGLIRIVHSSRLSFVSGHRNAATVVIFDVRDTHNGN